MPGQTIDLHAIVVLVVIAAADAALLVGLLALIAATAVTTAQPTPSGETPPSPGRQDEHGNGPPRPDDTAEER